MWNFIQEQAFKFSLGVQWAKISWETRRGASSGKGNDLSKGKKLGIWWFQAKKRSIRLYAKAHRKCQLHIHRTKLIYISSPS